MLQTVHKGFHSNIKKLYYCCCPFRMQIYPSTNMYVKWILNYYLVVAVHTLQEGHSNRRKVAVWNKSKEINTAPEPNGVWLIDQQLWVCHKDEIVTYNLDLEKLSSIPTGNMGRVYAVVRTSIGKICVAADLGLYQLTNAGIYITFTVLNLVCPKLFATPMLSTIFYLCYSPKVIFSRICSIFFQTLRFVDQIPLK